MPGPHERGRVLLPAVAIALLPALAQPAASQEVVDVELILAVDVSLSVSPTELAIQRDGYAAALTHESVIAAIRDGLHGRVAVAYVEWAGSDMQRIVVPWTVIAGREDAESFAERLTMHPPSSARRTSITGALQFALDMFAESSFRGLKRVVDVSGDGPNNQGGPVVEGRDALVEQGVTINGLPLMTSSGYTSVYDIENLDLYYEECVIGGPGAFVIPVNDWNQFPEAVRRKLVLELVGDPDGLPGYDRALPVVRIADEPPIDCEVGERIWGNRGWIWDSR